MDYARIDRRVSVETTNGNIVQRLSELREHPYLVLLGEPGAGKSTAFQYEAELEDTKAFTCRELVNGLMNPGSKTAYLDALDEYRSSGDGKDKIILLAKAIKDTGVSRWRISCRAEDWRHEADKIIIEHATNGQAPTVAHLLPLEQDEIHAVLMSLGETDPDSFISEAIRHGARAFLESPLSLKLLHTVVDTDKHWPETRFQLFERAVYALVHEHDPVRSADDRPPPEQILSSASIICFYFLVSGARALWHSNTLPPSLNSNDYIRLDSFELETKARIVVDTALFRGEQNTFRPFHRTIAEFLAGRYLAGRILTQPLFPLRRAVALVTGFDSKAPSELRGLYAWFTAHLYAHGDHKGAQRLIERDAATVLAYGDVSILDTDSRRCLLNNLDTDDPYFLSSLEGVTVFGGLADESLTEEFVDILNSEERVHLQRTVLRALGASRPIAAMRQKLRQIVLDDTRPLWIRASSADVLIHQAENAHPERCSLLRQLSNSDLKSGAPSLRAEILADMPVELIKSEDLQHLIHDFNALAAQTPNEEDLDVRSALLSLEKSLAKSPRPDFFDDGIGEKRNNQYNCFDVRYFLNNLLVATIDQHLQIDAERLDCWLNNVRVDLFDPISSDVSSAVQRWIEVDDGKRELALFLVMMEKNPIPNRLGLVINLFSSTIQRLPSEHLIGDLISLARNKTKSRERRKLLKLAALLARYERYWSDWKNVVLRELEREGRFKTFITDLCSNPNSRFERREAKRNALEEANKSRARKANIRYLMPKIEVLKNCDADAFDYLLNAANFYRNIIIKDSSSPIDSVIESTNAEIALALIDGCINYAAQGNLEIGVQELAGAAARNTSIPAEYVVLAGLHYALFSDREAELDSCPPIVALIGLRHRDFSRDENRLVANWALRRLGRNVKQGAELIIRYWYAAEAAGDEDLDLIAALEEGAAKDLVSETIKTLLRERPNLPEVALTQGLIASTNALKTTLLVELVLSASASPNLGERQQAIWNFASLILNPKSYSNKFTSDQLETALLAPRQDLWDAFEKLCPDIDQLDLIIIQILGRRYPASNTDWMQDFSASNLVRSAIFRIGSSDAPDSGELLRHLIPTVHSSWKDTIVHAAAEHARKKRDQHYTPPIVSELKTALANGPPVSSHDLTAVVLEELERYQATLKTSAETPRKSYWNTDQYGAATSPKIENECRDRLLEILRVRFDHYGIAANSPEAAMAENTRADLLLVSYAGNVLPIEAKRHFNKEIWTAPLDQLAEYAADPNAFGFGVYLVFWFGAEHNLPPRKDNQQVANNPTALRNMLIEDLPEALKDKLQVIVLDVSRPQSEAKAVEQRAKNSKG